MVQQPLMGQGLLSIEALRLHSRTHTHTFNTTPLDVGSARRRDLYLTAHNSNKRQIFMPPAEFERTVLESKQTHALYHTATETSY
jgi:hypothetical protein